MNNSNCIITSNQLPLLSIRNLSVSFHTYAGEVQAVRDVSFDLDRGETLGIVGESGCGKSVTAQTILKLNPEPPAEIKAGQVILDGRDIVPLSDREMQKIRGAEVSMIFQDPMTCLNPTMTIGKQVGESLVLHQKIHKRVAFERAIDLLDLVKIPNAAVRAKQYPHQFSGGMRQRAMIAMALACNPKLLIADEPTTALDVTIQAQILELMRELKNKTNNATILITHDLGIVASMSDRIAVMYAGKIIEIGPSDEVFYRPQHPYTWGLLDSRPRVDHPRDQKLDPIEGMPPDLIQPPKGCGFADRCRFCMRVCREIHPPETIVEDGHKVCCWLQHPQAPKVSRGDSRK
jgi:oligopeptide transport system ATP-binding protein